MLLFFVCIHTCIKNKTRFRSVPTYVYKQTKEKRKKKQIKKTKKKKTYDSSYQQQWNRYQEEYISEIYTNILA